MYHRGRIGKMYKELLTIAIRKSDAGGTVGEFASKIVFGRLGAFTTNLLKQYITIGSHLTPNKSATILKKGSSRPLVDSGRLVNSISWEIQ